MLLEGAFLELARKVKLYVRTQDRLKLKVALCLSVISQNLQSSHSIFCMCVVHRTLHRAFILL